MASLDQWGGRKPQCRKMLITQRAWPSLCQPWPLSPLSPVTLVQTHFSETPVKTPFSLKAFYVPEPKYICSMPKPTTHYCSLSFWGLSCPFQTSNRPWKSEVGPAGVFFFLFDLCINDGKVTSTLWATGADSVGMLLAKGLDSEPFLGALQENTWGGCLYTYKIHWGGGS